MANLHDEVDRERIRKLGTSTVVQGLISWRGTLELADEPAARNILKGGVSRLRLRDGREGDFTVSKAESDPSSGHLVITGSGLAPF